jgi:hypothetical protein
MDRYKKDKEIGKGYFKAMGILKINLLALILR